MTIQLNPDLLDFFNNMIIEFKWNDKFHIDFMNYFPLLKKGVTTKKTYYKIMTIYVNYYQRFKSLRSYLSSKTYSINENKIIDVNINDELLNESNLANSLLATIKLSSVECDDELFKLVSNFNNNSISSKIKNEVLKTSSIRLLTAVLYNNTEDIITALYVDGIDYYIGYIDLYLLAISYKYFKIPNILKEIIIIKNLLMKEALVISFENLIGPSDIPNVVFDIIIK